MTVDTQLINEALEDIRPHDGYGDMAKKIKRLGDVAAMVTQFGVDVVDRKSLATIVIGDDAAAVETLAKAYAKALRGYGLVGGKNGNDAPVIHSIDWTSTLEDICATRQMIEQSWAAGKIEEAGAKAQGGTLIIRDIHKKPYAGYPDEEDATPKALKGGLDKLKSLMSEAATGENDTPVLVLVGPKAGIVEFIRENPEMKEFFNNTAMRAAPPPRDMPLELEAAITVGRPLALKAPARG